MTTPADAHSSKAKGSQSLIATISASIFASSLAVGLAAVTALVVASYVHALKIQAPKNLQIVAAFIEGGLVEPLWNWDFKAAQALLDASAIDPALVTAEVFDHSGALVASYSRKAEAATWSIEHSGLIRTAAGSNTTGSVHLVYDSGLIASQSYTLAAMLVALVAVMSIGSGLAIRKALDRKIAKPVARMANTAMRIGAGELAEPILDTTDAPTEIRELTEALDATRGRIANLLLGLQSMVENLEDKVTERTAALTEAMENLKRAQASLFESEKFAALGALVAGVAHDLNTPIGNARLALSSATHFAEQLNAALNASQPPKKSDIAKLCSKVVESCQVAEANASRSAELVGSFMRLSVDRASEKKRVFELSDVARQALDASMPGLRPCGITVEDRALAAGLELDSYPGTLGQMLTNLFDNAKIHGLGGKPGRIALGCTRDERERGSAILWVADDGSGISPEDLSKVFDPFFTTRIGEGSSGLGLSNVANLARKVLGGSAKIYSPIPPPMAIKLFGTPVATGTLVEIKLPLAAMEYPSPKA